VKYQKPEFRAKIEKLHTRFTLQILCLSQWVGRRVGSGFSVCLVMALSHDNANFLNASLLEPTQIRTQLYLFWTMFLLPWNLVLEWVGEFSGDGSFFD
jgi:hypothetical protein